MNSWKVMVLVFQIETRKPEKVTVWEEGLFDT